MEGDFVLSVPVADERNQTFTGTSRPREYPTPTHANQPFGGGGAQHGGKNSNTAKRRRKPALAAPNVGDAPVATGTGAFFQSTDLVVGEYIIYVEESTVASQQQESADVRCALPKFKSDVFSKASSNPLNKKKLVEDSAAFKQRQLKADQSCHLQLLDVFSHDGEDMRLEGNLEERRKQEAQDDVEAKYKREWFVGRVLSVSENECLVFPHAVVKDLETFMDTHLAGVNLGDVKGAGASVMGQTTTSTTIGLPSGFLGASAMGRSTSPRPSRINSPHSPHSPKGEPLGGTKGGEGNTVENVAYFKMKMSKFGSTGMHNAVNPTQAEPPATAGGAPSVDVSALAAAKPSTQKSSNQQQRSAKREAGAPSPRSLNRQGTKIFLNRSNIEETSIMETSSKPPKSPSPRASRGAGRLSHQEQQLMNLQSQNSVESLLEDLTTGSLASTTLDTSTLNQSRTKNPNRRRGNSRRSDNNNKSLLEDPTNGGAVPSRDGGLSPGPRKRDSSTGGPGGGGTDANNNKLNKTQMLSRLGKHAWIFETLTCERRSPSASMSHNSPGGQSPNVTSFGSFRNLPGPGGAGGLELSIGELNSSAKALALSPSNPSFGVTITGTSGSGEPPALLSPSAPSFRQGGRSLLGGSQVGGSVNEAATPAPPAAAHIRTISVKKKLILLRNLPVEEFDLMIPAINKKARNPKQPQERRSSTIARHPRSNAPLGASGMLSALSMGTSVRKAASSMRKRSDGSVLSREGSTMGTFRNQGQVVKGFVAVPVLVTMLLPAVWHSFIASVRKPIFGTVEGGGAGGGGAAGVKRRHSEGEFSGGSASGLLSLMSPTSPRRRSSVIDLTAQLQSLGSRGSPGFMDSGTDGNMISGGIFELKAPTGFPSFHPASSQLTIAIDEGKDDQQPAPSMVQCIGASLFIKRFGTPGTNPREVMPATAPLASGNFSKQTQQHDDSDNEESHRTGGSTAPPLSPVRWGDSPPPGPQSGGNKMLPLDEINQVVLRYFPWEAQEVNEYWQDLADSVATEMNQLRVLDLAELRHRILLAGHEAQYAAIQNVDALNRNILTLVEAICFRLESSAASIGNSAVTATSIESSRRCSGSSQPLVSGAESVESLTLQHLAQLHQPPQPLASHLFQTLSSVALCFMSLSDATVAPLLAQCHKLTSLSLSHNSLGDGTVGALAANVHLRAFKPRGAEKEYSHLAQLRLDGNNLDDHACWRLKDEVLAKNHSLRFVDLRFIRAQQQVRADCMQAVCVPVKQPHWTKKLAPRAEKDVRRRLRLIAHCLVKGGNKTKTNLIEPGHMQHNAAVRDTTVYGTGVGASSMSPSTASSTAPSTTKNSGGALMLGPATKEAQTGGAILEHLFEHFSLFARPAPLRIAY